jgi:hypothetical protein
VVTADLHYPRLLAVTGAEGPSLILLRGGDWSEPDVTARMHRAYLQAVEEAFGADIDYSMLIKLYGEPPSSPEAARRYSPSECVGTRTETITGNPDPKHVTTS